MKPPPPRIPLSTRILYGVGAVAHGVKDNGFGYFLLIYYNQVVGLSPTLTGAALMVALLVDAVTDPVIGYVSDNWHSRWKRRHPFMYFSALPLAVCWVFLWNPPAGLGEPGLFLYLVVTAVSIRTLVTLYEIPSISLVPELTDDYDERTALLSFRYFFGWYGGLTMAALAYTVFLRDTPEYPNGVLDPAGYQTYGTVGAVAIFASVLICAAGTHRHIPDMRLPPERRIFSLRAVFRDMAETLSNRSFLVLFWASLFAFVGAGLAAGLNLYMNTYFWGLGSSEIRYIVFLQFVSALLAFAAAPALGRRLDKKTGAMATFGVAIFWGPGPVLLRLAGLFPGNESPALLPLLMLHGLVEVTLLVMLGIYISSMLADIAEENEIRTGRREEGLFFAARSFAMKATSGIGVLLAGVTVDLIGLPRSATPGEVDPDVLFRLGIVFGPMLMGLYLVALGFVSRYGISRRGHADNLAILARRE